MNVVDYTEFPGPRYKKLGPCSGEDYRTVVLLPAIDTYGTSLAINLDGTMGYGSSFLEEAFGGLLRNGVPAEVAKAIGKNLISNEDPSLIPEIQGYIKEAIARL